MSASIQEMGQIMARAAKVMKDNGHICVLLDLIPVDEAEPQHQRPVAGLRILNMCGMDISPSTELPEEVCFANGDWWMGRHRISRPESITHWAEIPQVSDAD